MSNQASESSNQLPDLSYVFIRSNPNGKFVGIVKKGEKGYYPTDYDEQDPVKAQQLVEDLNEGLGVTPLQAECMSNGSMFGWHLPGADLEYMSKTFPH